MDSDFRGGRKQKTIEPLNNLTAPKLPDFSALEEDRETPAGDVIVENDSETGTQPPASGVVVTEHPAATPQKQQPSGRQHWRLGKRPTIILAAVAVLLIGGGIIAAYQAQPHGQGGTFISNRPTHTPKVTTVASNLSGLQVDPSINTRPVVGIMIENSTDARPQSGLDQADIVFEAIAEGGITRFLALFHDNMPDYIGPVRSARPYFVQWCMSFDCAFAHAGGSPEALQNIVDWGTKDLNHNTSAFWRITSRYAPHNLYTSLAKLHEYASSKGYGTADFTPLARKNDTASKTPDAGSIDIAISSAAFNSRYDYDAASNSYARSQAGAAHTVIDAGGTSTQLKPKVIVAMVQQYGVASDKHSQYGVIGSGEAFVFQDGTVTKGSWNKADRKGALELKSPDGSPLKINAGQTWFVAVSTASKVTYR